MICAIDASGSINLENPIAQGVCKGSEAYKLYPTKETGETSFTIALDKPAVVDSEYAIIVDGFRGEGFKYFNPLMSVVPREDHAAMLMKLESAVGSGYVVRFTSVVGTSLGLLKSSFYINPFLTYTYLQDLNSDAAKIQAKDEAIEVGTEPVDICFDSFYPAEKYTVSAPEWCKAELSGRYDQFKLTMCAENAPEGAEGEVVIECPGEKKVIPVKAMILSAINDVTVGGQVVKTEYFDLSGRTIAKPENGMYIIRNTYSNGVQQATKVIK